MCISKKVLSLVLVLFWLFISCDREPEKVSDDPAGDFDRRFLWVLIELEADNNLDVSANVNLTSIHINHTPTLNEV